MNKDYAGRPALCVDDVSIIDQLDQRPQRVPDYAGECRALSTLAEEMAHHPEGVLQRVAELAMELCRADSAVISVLEPGGEHDIFRWHAASGAAASILYGTIPRDASPCGKVVDRNELLLLQAPERHFPALGRLPATNIRKSSCSVDCVWGSSWHALVNQTHTRRTIRCRGRSPA